jgi:translation initiation factor IF-2
LRVHELAKELGVTSKELLATLEQMGAPGRSASSSVPEELVPRLRASGGKVTATGKPREVLEPPPSPRKPKSKTKKQTEAGGAAEEPIEPPAEKVGATLEAEPSTEATGSHQVVDRRADRAAVPGRPVLQVARGATPQTIADRVDVAPADVVKTLFMAGEMVTATTSLSDEAITLVADDLGYDVEIVAVEDEFQKDALEEEQVDESKLVPRPPVVTVMGHVDHGKTRLLDAIRNTNVVAGEVGGITQHIGAYQVHTGGRDVTFIDTPGHEAFTAMRARGASVTDLAVLVVAADDGVMPQTLEALDHAKAAGVPIVVAVNKIDKENADPNRVRTQLTEHDLVPSEWGGDTEFVDVSAKEGTNLQDLLDTLLVVADLAELKGDPTGRARGTVIEAHLDKGRGPIATVLVQKGSLDVGDALISGVSHCRIRAMQDENGDPVLQAGPSKPVQILGWSSVPVAGDDVLEVADEREARHLAAEREARARAAELVTTRPTSLQDLMRRAERAEIPELNLVVKADVQGSLGALTDSLLKIPQDEVRVGIVRSGAGAISESDVSLALASDAIVVGFNVRPDAGARELAEREGVDVRLYRVIYDAIDDIRAALSGLLKPEVRESILGEAEVRQTFRVPRLGIVAGCYVQSGVIRRNSSARLVRDGVVVYEGKVASLRRFKDDVAEVRDGFECGIGLESFQDMKEGDMIEAFEVEEVAREIS